jgi:dUTP pyrophosphatase
MLVKVKRLYPNVNLPAYATEGAACFDLEAYVPDDVLLVEQGRPVVVDTGLAFAVPKGYVMKIYSRSGHGFNLDTRLANCVGIIDSDYRGEVKVKLTCDSPYGRTLLVKHGDRIAQAMVEPVPFVQFQEADELDDTARGAAGFGSTGA